ncbi:hypothetical protein H5410_036235 [Solanum commersonii]|uniref:Uncharacterized protein n=1 Tax=Solanum commersonii TaxID=4109 RepID=A0A9J5Y2Z9_SOLCO|nr:hypothetical protein H5410_036235 [Solanum commersonii]
MIADLAGPAYKLEFSTIGKRLNISEKQSRSGIWGPKENHLNLLPQNRSASSLFSLEILEIQVSSCFRKEYENLLVVIHLTLAYLATHNILFRIKDAYENGPHGGLELAGIIHL